MSIFTFEAQYQFYLQHKDENGDVDNRVKGICTAMRMVADAEEKILQEIRDHRTRLDDIERSITGGLTPWGPLNRPEELAAAIDKRKLGYQMLDCLLTKEEATALGLPE